MRFRYLDVDTPEYRARIALEAQFDQFWSAFRDAVAAAPDPRKSSDWIVALMRERLPLSGTRIEWEAGPDASGDMKLVLTAAGERGLRPAVGRLVELAPQIDGWSVVDYRQPEPATVAPMLLDGRAGRHARPIETPAFRVADGRHGLIDVECLATNATEEPIMRSLATLLVEILVGEQAYDAWIGAITLAPMPRRGLLRRPAPPDGAVGPEMLRGAVERKIAERVARLPDRPRHALSDAAWAALGATADDHWTTYKVDPAPADADGDWLHMADRHFATVREPPLFEATLAYGFDSRRFSRVGERFAYLKFEHAGIWLAEQLLDRRDAFYDALDLALRGAEAGRAWGTASGLRYLYIELALADVDAAIPLIRAAAVEAGVGDRSWLLFHDADLCDEWIGLTPETPAPPRASAH